MKKCLILIIIVSIFLSFAIPIKAQTIVGEWVTGVGDPKTDRPGQGLSGVVGFAKQITDALTVGPIERIWGMKLFNELDNEIANGFWHTGTFAGTNDATVYWCTYLVIDSYSLSGFQGFLKNKLTGGMAGVLNMRAWWMGQGQALGYYYLDTDKDPKTILKVVPGDAMFEFDNCPGQCQHVALVREVCIHADGTGHVTTLESNSGSRGKQLPVVNWKVQGAVHGVHGFGGNYNGPPHDLPDNVCVL
jgi:hypothetical protein